MEKAPLYPGKWRETRASEQLRDKRREKRSPQLGKRGEGDRKRRENGKREGKREGDIKKGRKQIRGVKGVKK